MSELTQLLQDAAQGNAVSAERLMPLIYERMRELAHRQLSRVKQQTMLTGDLVHEAYFHLFGNENLGWNDRSHFFAYAAKAMRNILLDRAKQRLRLKRGAQAVHVAVDEAVDLVVDNESYADLIALDQCLTRMAEKHPRLVRVIELRFFAGMSVPEVAKLLDLTARSVERDWLKARAFINEFLERPLP